MKVLEWYKRQSVSKRIQIVAASICTIALMVGAPAAAWFSFQNQIDAMTRVNEPPVLTLASGGKDAIECFELRNINVDMKDKSGEYRKDFVFSVEPGKITTYDLQLAHTTNIPFTYSLYRAVSDDNGPVVYVAEEMKNEKNVEYHYTISGGNLLETVPDYNPDDGKTGRFLGIEDTLPEDWKTYNQNDIVDLYAIPLYSIARDIERITDETDGRDYFVLRVEWNVTDSASDDYWNYAFNNKETDIIYLSAAESTE